MEEGTDQPRDHAYVYALTPESAYLQTEGEEKPAIIAEPIPDLASFVCSFCRKSAEQLFGSEYPVREPNTFAIIAHVLICNECVARFADALAQQARGLHRHRRSTGEIGLAVPGRPIRSLAAEDRSAGRRPRPDGTGASQDGGGFEPLTLTGRTTRVPYRMVKPGTERTATALTSATHQEGVVQMRDPSAADPWHLPATEFTKATIILETDEGVVATVECAPETVGDPAGGVWVRIGQAPVTPEARASVRDAEVVGGPMVTVTAGRVSVRRAG